jgi:DNA-directed RNA polymerase specialized sigma24 family protein
MITALEIQPDLEVNAFPADLPATEGSIADINRSLEGLDRYIRDVAKQQVSRDSRLFNNLDDEINDLAQTALIAYWKIASKNGQIVSPKAYIKAIIRSRYIDMMRQRKHKTYLPLPVDQDGELYQGNVLLMPGDELMDAALQYERKELIAEVVADVINLSHCQQRAMICMLKDEVGDTLVLEAEFRKHGVDISGINWPTDPGELKTLKSSLSIARMKMRSFKSKYYAA